MDDVRFHPEAQVEYQDALAWYQDALAWYYVRSAQAAARFEAELDRVIGLIAANPGLFPSYDDAHRFCRIVPFV